MTAYVSTFIYFLKDSPHPDSHIGRRICVVPVLSFNILSVALFQKKVHHKDNLFDLLTAVSISGQIREKHFLSLPRSSVFLRTEI